jgi:hypothetical protein
MDNIVLQISIVSGVIFFFGVIILLLRKNAFSLKYALLWLLTAAAMLALAIFPGILTRISHALGFEVASNALFTLLLGFVIIILLQQTAIVSQQSEKIKNLGQTNALLEKRIRELEESRK